MAERGEKQSEYAEQATRRWLEDTVIGLNLCPFARRELVGQRVRFLVTEATDDEGLLQALASELGFLESHSEIETTLLIHPYVLTDFADYNDFLDIADGLLMQLELEGVFQVASFHPDYQFEGTRPEDAENYTNRSPFPMLHLLREASVEQAVNAYPDIDAIPERNVELMKTMGQPRLAAMLAACFTDSRESSPPESE